MTGTIINAAAILVGGIVGLSAKKHMSPQMQTLIKAGLGVFTVYAGLAMSWEAFGGGFKNVVKQAVVVMLSLILGNLIGKALRIQKGLNRLGQYANERFQSTKPGDANRFSDGFVTCSILFCVGPMALLGSIQDGLTGEYKTLAIKSVMDGLATMAFVGTFGWGVMLSIIPVVAYQGTITMGAALLRPYVHDTALIHSVNATGGLLVVCISLIILEVRKVELGDYLPSLAVAPLLTWLWT
ncbi:MAG: DUF554 domain-containing protein [Verrucomicrobiota bacterium]